MKKCVKMCVILFEMLKSVFKHTYQTGPKIVKLQNFRGKKIQKRLKIYFGTFLVGYCYP